MLKNSIFWKKSIQKNMTNLDNDSMLLKNYYFLVKNAYIDYNLKNLKIFLNEITKINKKDNNLINNVLNKNQISDLKNIIYAYKNNVFVRKLDSVPAEENEYELEINDNFSIAEKDLKYKLLNNLNVFENILNLKVISFLNEFETQNGPCDIILKGDNYRAAVELKAEVANHKIIGQVLKYVEYYEKKLNYELWDYVYGVTIAKNYTKFAYKELKKLNITTLRYYFEDNKINLVKV